MSDRMRLQRGEGIGEQAWIDRIETVGGPRYLAILACLEDAIRTGQLAPRAQLPPQRRLAEMLDLTVGTTGRAYAIAAERGLITGETGRGTFVSENPFGGGEGSIKPLRGALADIGRLRPRTTEYSDERQIIDLALPAAPGSQITQILLRAMTSLIDRQRLVLPRKIVSRRAPARYSEAAARWIAGMGLDVEPSQVVVTANATQGIAATVLFNSARGESILTSALTYPGLKVLAFNYGWHLEVIESDDDGILPDALERAAVKGLGRVVYLQSELHNPTAASMSLARRRAIAETAARHDLILIDDCAALSELRSQTTPLAALAPEHTFLVASATKSVGVSLSAGYVVAPPGWGERFELQIRDRYFQPVPMGAEVMTYLIESGEIDEVAGVYRTTIARRTALLKDNLPEALFAGDPRAFFVWLQLPPHWHSEAFASACVLSGVTVAAAGNFQVGMMMNVPAVRISLLGSISDEAYVEGLTRLRALLLSSGVSTGVIV